MNRPLTRLENLIEVFNSYNTHYNRVLEKWEITSNSTYKINYSDIHFLVALPYKDFIEFLREIRLILKSKTCPCCSTVLTKIYYMNNRSPFFRCNKRRCVRAKYSLLKNSLFEESHVGPNKMFYLLNFFASMRVQSDVEQSLSLGDASVRSIYRLFRESLLFWLSKRNTRVGGEGIMVHIDETPITRRHGNQGRTSPSNTVWVIGVVDIIKKKASLEFLPSRGHLHILPFILRWVELGTTVHTDSHKSYDILSSLGFDHHKVNHSRHLVSPDGTHTNHIEGIFGNMKRLKRHYNYQWTDAEHLNLMCSEWVFRYCYNGFHRPTAMMNLIVVLRELFSLPEFQ